MPSGIGLQEVLLIGLLVLLLFGPKGVSGIMRDLGRWTGKMKKYRDDFTQELMAISQPKEDPAQLKRAERRRIRGQCKKAMEEMPPEQREKESREVEARLVSLPEYQAAKRIFCFASRPEEVDTLSLIERMLKDGKELFVPFCLTDTKDLGMARIREVKADLETGTYRIPEPRKELRLPVDLLTPDLFLIPGLAFDDEMTRLGRGAGYFDRFLKAIKGKRPIWALCLSVQIHPYVIPREEHDISPDLIINPYTILRPKS
jgi:5-formyltetrahydrofolate cyclo-ligase